MALHNQLPIYRAALDLTCQSSRLVAHMPRNHRSVDGARLVAESRELLQCIRRVNEATEKLPFLNALIGKIDDVGVELRICLELRLFSKEAYARVAALVGSIGKQAGGWKRKFSESSPSHGRQGNRDSAF